MDSFFSHLSQYIWALSIAFVPLFSRLMNWLVLQLEIAAFKYLPKGRLRTLLISGFAGTTPETLEELREQRRQSAGH